MILAAKDLGHPRSLAPPCVLTSLLTVGRGVVNALLINLYLLLVGTAPPRMPDERKLRSRELSADVLQ